MGDQVSHSDLMTKAESLVRIAAPQLLDQPYETWNFGDSTGFEGLVRASELLAMPEFDAFAYAWFRAWATRAEPYRRLDCTAPGLAIVTCAQRHGDSELLGAAESLGRYLLTRRKIRGAYETWESSPLMAPYGGEELPPDEQVLLDRKPPGVFIDCLHFDPPFFAALAKATGNSKWADEAIEQAQAYIDNLQLNSGLFEHFFLDGVPDKTFGPGWGRGQGWALLGLLDVIEQLELPPDSTIVESAQKLIKAMVNVQRSDGHWAVVVTDPDSGDEPSTAAFMATGFMRAKELGVVEGHEVDAPVDAALSAIISDCDEQGRLSGVSRAVMACTRPSHYANVPRGFNVPWGQGPLVLALLEKIKT